MKPPAFDYVAVDTLDEAIALLAEHGDDAKLLAGGQSLVPLMNMRLAQPRVLVDIAHLDALAGIECNDALSIGATTRQSAVLRSAEAADTAPIVQAALRHVAHTAIRNRGTFGGSAAHADPASEIPAILLALDAELVVAGPNGRRTIPACDFFVTLFTTQLAADEVLVEIRIPAGGRDRAWAFDEVAPRHGDFALVGTAVVAEAAGDREVSSARVVLFGVADKPIRAVEAEQFLAGRSLADEEAAREAGRLAAAPLDPPSDTHAPGRYRQEVAAVLVERALLAAGRRAHA